MQFVFYSISLLLIFLGLFLIFFIKLFGRSKSKLKFERDFLILSDGTRIFYKNIISINLKSIYISNHGWEPRIQIKYNTRSLKREFLIKPQFFPRPSYLTEIFNKDYETNKSLQRLRRYMPEKIGEILNNFLNNEKIKFEDLEPMDKMVGVELIKARGSFRLKK